MTAASSLSRIDPCLDPEQLSRVPPAPLDRADEVATIRGDIARAGALGRAGKRAEALAAATRARDAAEALAWPPLVVKSRLYEAEIQEDFGHYGEAERLGRAAYFEAARAGLWEDACNSATELAFVVGHRAMRTGEGLTWGEHAEVALSRANDPLNLYRASLRNNMATLRYDAGEHAVARSLFEEALVLRETGYGTRHPVVAHALNNLANVDYALGDYDSARSLHERVLVMTEEVFGSDHPDLVVTLENLALLLHRTNEYERALPLHERALAIEQRAHGEDSPMLAAILVNFGNATHATGASERARVLHERSLAIFERRLGPRDPNVALALTALADVHSTVGDHGRARELLERAVGIYDEREGEQAGELDARLSLAKALAASPEGIPRARALAELTLAAHRAAETVDEERVAEVEGFLAALAASHQRAVETRQ